MDDLPAHVDRRPVPLERIGDGENRTFDAGTESVRGGEQNPAPDPSLRRRSERHLSFLSLASRAPAL
jgi:hypothetical protein